jgi:xylulokinase
VSRAADRPAFLGIDLGTSAVKALLVDADGVILGEGTGPLTLVADTPLKAEQDAEAWWQAAVTAVQVCLAMAPKARVQAVGLTGQKHALLALDADDRPLAPAVLWADGRAHAEAEEMRLIFPAAARRTGALPLPGFLLPKWLRFRRTQRALADRTRRLCFAKDYLRLRLTGTVGTDVSDASATALFDIRARTWSG